MNGNVSTIKSYESAKETGIVWGFNFEWPGEHFLENFDWRVTDAGEQTIYEFEAYAFRKLVVGGRPILNMRFRDRHWRPIPEGKKLVAILHSPSA